jgi:hypothetical protein
MLPEEYYLLECDEMYSGEGLLTFRRNILAPLSESNSKAGKKQQQTSVNCYQTIQRHIAEYDALQIHCCESLKHSFSFFYFLGVG